MGRRYVYWLFDYRRSPIYGALYNSRYYTVRDAGQVHPTATANLAITGCWRGPDHLTHMRNMASGWIQGPYVPHLGTFCGQHRGLRAVDFMYPRPGDDRGTFCHRCYEVWERVAFAPHRLRAS